MKLCQVCSNHKATHMYDNKYLCEECYERLTHPKYVKMIKDSRKLCEKCGETTWMHTHNNQLLCEACYLPIWQAYTKKSVEACSIQDDDGADSYSIKGFVNCTKYVTLGCPKKEDIITIVRAIVEDCDEINEITIRKIR